MVFPFNWFKGEKPSAIGRLTYAVGDVHGRFDLFDEMVQSIRKDAGEFDETPVIVLLGDYIDRGGGSRDVLQRIITLQGEGWCDVVVLMGNHEQVLLRFLKEPVVGISWADYGGVATLASYGVQVPVIRSDLDVWGGVRDEFLAALPASHLALLESMGLYYVDGDYLFVHAGVQPGVPIDAQGADTFLWIRSAFLSVRRACHFVVVHGHTPEAEPSNVRWRIGLDTGAYATNVLSGVRLRGNTRRLLRVT